MPDTANREALPTSSEPELPVPKGEAAKKPRRGPPSPIPSTSKEIVYETPKQGFHIPDDDDDDDVEDEGAQTEGENVVTAASPRRFSDTQYGIRKDGE